MRADPRPLGIGAPVPNYGVQLATIMRTVSTFSFGALDELEDEPAVVVAPAVVDDEDEPSIVPVTSTLCPTCALNFASSASSRYVLPAEDAALDGLVEDVPAVPAVVPAVVLVPPDEPDDPDDDAFVRMKLDSVELADPVVPEVPVAPDVADEPRWTQPVTVT